MAARNSGMFHAVMSIATIAFIAILLTGCEILTPSEQAQLDAYEKTRACVDSLWRADSLHATVWRIPACEYVHSPLINF